MTYPDHANQERSADHEMFAPPPADIGTVLSGATTLRTSYNGPSPLVRYGTSALIAAILLGIAFLYGSSDAYAIAMLVSAVIITYVWWRTRFKDQVVTYVGTAGIARITMTGGRGGTTHTELLRFADADCLRVAVTQHARTSVYNQNSFEYRWFDRRDFGMYTIGGQYVTQAIPADVQQFARAAEAAWSVHRLARYESDLERDGTVGFPLQSGKTIWLGNGYMELRGFQADPVRLKKDELEALTLHQGKYRITHVDATWYGKGKFAIDYESMANPQLFTVMMKKLMDKTLPS